MEFMNPIGLVEHQNTFLCNEINSRPLKLTDLLSRLCIFLNPDMFYSFFPCFPYHAGSLVLPGHHYQPLHIVRQAFNIRIDLSSVYFGCIGVHRNYVHSFFFQLSECGESEFFRITRYSGHCNWLRSNEILYLL